MKYCNIVTAIIISSYTCIVAVSSYYLLVIYSIVSLQYCTVYRVDSQSIYYTYLFYRSGLFGGVVYSTVLLTLPYCITAVYTQLTVLEIAAVHLTCQY